MSSTPLVFLSLSAVNKQVKLLKKKLPPPYTCTYTAVIYAVYYSTQTRSLFTPQDIHGSDVLRNTPVVVWLLELLPLSWLQISQYPAQESKLDSNIHSQHLRSKLQTGDKLNSTMSLQNSFNALSLFFRNIIPHSVFSWWWWRALSKSRVKLHFCPENICYISYSLQLNPAWRANSSRAATNDNLHSRLIGQFFSWSIDWLFGLKRMRKMVKNGRSVFPKAQIDVL